MISITTIEQTNGAYERIASGEVAILACCPSQSVMFAWLIVLILSVHLLDVASCATTTYTVQIDTQATIVGYEYDNPPGLAFFGIPYAQPMNAQNRFAVRLSISDESGST